MDTFIYNEGEKLMGRPKGAKNKNPYPKSEAVIKRLEKQIQYPALLAKQGNEDNRQYYTPEVREKMSKIKIEQIMAGRNLRKNVYYQGRFKIKNPKKYKGDPNNIVYRSSWELSFMMKLDASKDVVAWSSEEIIVPYTCPVDRGFHRYIPDFYVERADGSKTIIEIKPHVQTKVPKRTEAKSHRVYLSEAKLFARNQAKWEAAQRYCEKRGWKFQVLTEKELKTF